MKELSKYYQRIDKALKAGNATEHTHRRALARLIESLGEDITATNEPKQIECGAPDYIVTQKSIPLGHIEAKDVGKNLDAAEKDEQLVRYLDALPNLILTDYLEFRWYVSGEHRMTARLDPANEVSFGAVTDLLTSFLEAKIQTINRPSELAAKMGGLARLMRNIIRRAFEAEGKADTLHSQLDGFRTVLIETLSEDEFADMYAQTICYGLFAARCNHDGPEPFTREKAAYELPKTNPFLRELFGHIAGPELDGRITWIVDDLAELLDRTNIARILEDFGKRTRREDPVVHFYETFLAEYDQTLRELRGVYYTPEPVVSYIVSSVDHILKNDFGLTDGIADTTMVELPEPIDGGKKTFPRVTILDPAVGTGTFLREVFSRIWEWVEKSGQKGAWSSYVAQFVLPRIFGFEFLMAPYAVCHMKLGLQLNETGYDFRENERLRVYLTNTLEEAHEYKDLPLFHEALAREALEAGQAKQDYPVMVVLGNPPYSGHSANKGKWIHELLRGKDISTDQKTHNYFEVDGAPLGERNPKWLNDDYVKFIRFAQWRIERTGSGILAFITNHGYLDNPTFRGMRQSLMETFDDIYILDLHGNAKKKEKAPGGTKDENVFDIQQGVAIGIFVKKKNGKRKAVKVRHADLWGTRESFGGPTEDQKLMGGKYHWLWENNIATTKWEKIKPESEWYLFKPINKSTFPEYMSGWKITDIMTTNSLGIATARDNFTIHQDRDVLVKLLSEFTSMAPDQARKRFDVKKDSSDWKMKWAQDDIKNFRDISDAITTISYRPFDERHTAYTGTVSGFMCRPRQDVMRHMINGPNLGISTTSGLIPTFGTLGFERR